MSGDQDTVHRHEGHFKKIFEILDEIRNNYVRSPTFVISLVTIVLIMAGSGGWVMNQVFSGIEANQESIVELAVQQGRLEERQESLEREQDKTITQLIKALEESQRVN